MKLYAFTLFIENNSENIMLCTKSSKSEIIKSFKLLIPQIVYIEESKTSWQIYMPLERIIPFGPCIAMTWVSLMFF